MYRLPTSAVAHITGIVQAVNTACKFGSGIGVGEHAVEDELLCYTKLVLREEPDSNGANA